MIANRSAKWAVAALTASVGLALAAASAQAQQLPEPFVLRSKRRQELSEIRGGVTFGSYLAEAHSTGSAFLGAGLQPHEWGEHGLAEPVGHGMTHRGRREQSEERKAETQKDEYSVSAGVTAV